MWSMPSSSPSATSTWRRSTTTSYIQTEVTAFEREKKRVITAQGWLDYDYLILGAGIRYNYEAWFGNDRKAADTPRRCSPPPTSRTPSTSNSSRASQNFTGGDLVMTLPPAASLPALTL